jgi:hypothetical protein
VVVTANFMVERQVAGMKKAVWALRLVVKVCWTVLLLGNTVPPHNNTGARGIKRQLFIPTGASGKTVVWTVFLFAPQPFMR